MQQACQTVASKLDVSWHTARQWTQQARRDGHTYHHQPEYLVTEVAKLRRETQELRATPGLLKAASGFRIGTRPKTSEMIQFIDKHRDRFSIEFICLGR